MPRRVVVWCGSGVAAVWQTDAAAVWHRRRRQTSAPLLGLVSEWKGRERAAGGDKRNGNEKRRTVRHKRVMERQAVQRAVTNHNATEANEEVKEERDRGGGGFRLLLVSSGLSFINIEALCAAPPEALPTARAKQIPLS